jgi:hypothetical protein
MTFDKSFACCQLCCLVVSLIGIHGSEVKYLRILIVKMKISIAVNVGRSTFIKPASHKKSSGHILLLWKARKIMSGHVALKSE